MANIGKSIQRTSQQWKQLLRQSASAVSISLRTMSTTPAADIDATLKKRLEGKVAVITGGAGAVGAATTKLFVAHGAQVVIADVEEAAGEALARDVGPGAVFKRTDVRDEQNVESTVAFAVKKFGKLDIMFNNAGVMNTLKPLPDLDLEQYDISTAVLVRGVVCGIKHAARAMIPNKSGVILNTSSISGVTTAISFPVTYSMNKMNLPGITKVASLHLGRHNIRVNSISPAAIPSALSIQWMRDLGVPMNYAELVARYKALSPLPDRHCTNEDIANAALFLCSAESSYVTGQNLVVDGGFCSQVAFDPFGIDYV